MDRDAKKKSKKEKMRKKKARDEAMNKVINLYNKNKFEECLDYINSLGNEGLKMLQVFSFKVLLLGHFKQHDEVLALQQRHEEFGHDELSYGVQLIYAYCNRKKNNLLEAYFLYQRVHDDKGVDEESFQNSAKWIRKLQPRIQSELDRLAQERATKFLDDELGPSSPKAASSSAVTASFASVDAPTLVEAASVAAPSLAEATSVDAPSLAEVASVAAPSLAEVASVAAPFSAVATSVAASPSKMMKFSDDGMMCFEMTKLDENSCLGIMKIGESCFPKSYIKIGEDCTLEIPMNLRKNSCFLKIDFSMYSYSLSSRVAIVEPVYPVRVFFELKLENFKIEAMIQSCEKWWEYIKDDFRSIFRGLICGIYAIYSAQKVCNDMETSLYVTEEGEAKIFHFSQEKFAYTQAQKEIDDLLSIMESIVTLIKPRRRSDLQTWLEEFELSYKLPEELLHFLKSLRVRKLQDSIQPTWLIDHPFIWSEQHRVHFIESLLESIKEGLIDNERFSNQLGMNLRLEHWKTGVLNDTLLDAIFNYKGESFYSADVSHVLNFIHAVFSHANDYEYDIIRGKKGGLTLEEKEMRVKKMYPPIYTALYDAVCDYAQDDSNLVRIALLSQAFERFSSCVLIY